VWHDSTDPTEFRLLKLVYNGQEFASTEDFVEAFQTNNLDKISLTVDPEWSGFSRQGDVLPGDDVQGAKQINPAGPRFNITGYTHIEYLGWAFDWSITPLTGTKTPEST